MAAGKIEVQMDKQGEGSPSQQSAENQSPGHPTIYQSSLKRPGEQSMLTNNDNAKLSSTAKKDHGESRDSQGAQDKVPISEKAAAESFGLGAEDASKSHNARLYVIQKVKKSGEAEPAPTATTPEEAYQTEPRESSSLKQIPAAIPDIPEIPDLGGQAPLDHLQHPSKMGGRQDPHQIQQK